MRTLAPLLALLVLAALLMFLWRISDGSGAGTGLGAGPDLSRADGSPDLAGAGDPTGARQDADGADVRGAAASAAELAQVTAERTARLHVTLVDEAGAPVAGSHLRLSHRRDGRNGMDDAWLVTDAEGIAQAEGLRPGSILVRPEVGDPADGELVAGEELRLEMVLAGSLPVVGRVLDARGRPVSGATVWVANGWNGWQGGFEVTTTGSDGRFALERVNPTHSLGAYAPGHGASELVDLDTVAREPLPMSVELHLTEAGGELTGVVRAPDGSPVAGARVAAGRGQAWSVWRPGGGQQETWSARVTTTDAEGRYRLVGLAPGDLPLSARAAGHPPYQTQVAVQDGGTLQHDVWLAAACSVEGLVLRPDGTPAEHAQVLLLPEPFEDSFPGQGPTDEGRPFRHPAVRTDAQGRFELTLLPPGELHLWAGLGTSMWTPWAGKEPEYVGECQTTLHLGPGERGTWEARLSSGHTIHGRVVHADGVPMPSVFVSAVDSDGRRVTADGDGEGVFHLYLLEDRPYTLSVQLWDPPEGTPPLELEGVRPSPDEVLLTAPYPAPVETEPGQVTLRLEDPFGRLTGPADVLLRTDHGTFWGLERQEDRYTQEVDADRYQPLVRFADETVLVGEWFELAPGEERDLGVLTIPAGCVLELTIVRPPGDPGEVFVRQQNVPYEPPGVVFPVGTERRTIEHFVAGEVLLELRGPGIGLHRERLQVPPGGKLEHRVELRAGREVVIACGLEREEGYGNLEFTLTDASGTELVERKLREAWIQELPYPLNLTLAPGSYPYHLRTFDGQLAEGRLEVPAREDTDPEGPLALPTILGRQP